MATIQAVVQVMEMLQDTKPASWKGFEGMDDKRAEKVAATWFIVLEPIPDETLVEAAIVISRQGGPHMPSPGDLYQKALELMDDQPPAEDAWALVLKRLKPYGENVALPPRAEKVLAGMGGRNALQDQNEEKWHRKAFIEAYDAETARDRERASLDPSRLLGSGC